MSKATCFSVLLLVALSGGAWAADRMNIIDFKTDKATLKGRTLELEGFLMPFTEGHGLLAGSIGDIHPVFIDVSKVERNQRRQMMACPSACKAVVRGKVGTVSVGQIGLVADMLTFTAD
jgi:hypothetical protein